MASLNGNCRLARFGVFEVDLQARELRKSGIKLKLHDQPFQVLTALLERPGELVTRQELRDRIWPANTFVDFDHGLNTAVNKLREVLGDRPDGARFIETVPRRGYRFLGPVEAVPEVPIPSAELFHESERPTVVITGQPTSRRIKLCAGLGAIVAAGTLIWAVKHRPSAEPGLFAVPLTTYTGLEDAPSFSPDGNQVAFAWNGAKQDACNIYVKQIGTENLVRVTSHPAFDTAPAWSPDGRYIAFTRTTNGDTVGIFLVPSIGGPERKLLDTLAGWGNQDVGVAMAGQCGLSWSPDSKWLAMSGRDPGESQTSIYLYSLETGEKRKLTHPPPGTGDGAPALSPDGRSLAFTRTIATAISEVFLLHLSEQLNAQGEPIQVTSVRRWAGRPAWTAHGRDVVFSLAGEFSLETELWRVPASGSGPAQRLRFAGEQGDSVAISRGGTRLAYRRNSSDRNIYRVDLRHQPEAPVNLISSTRHDIVPQYSPDGRKIVFISARSGDAEVWACNSDGSGAVQLTFLRAQNTGCPRWSPDGKRIVFCSNAEGQWENYVMDADGGAPNRLTNDPADDAVPSWSRDGRWIYFVSNRSTRWQVWKMPADGGQPVQVTRNGGYVAFESMDGRFLYYSKSLWQSPLWRMPSSGGPETKILDRVGGLGFAVAPKGIYFMEQGTANPRLELLNDSTGEVRALARIVRSPEGDSDFGLSISPDERYAIFQRLDQAGSDLMLVDNFQ